MYETGAVTWELRALCTISTTLSFSYSQNRQLILIYPYGVTSCQIWGDLSGLNSFVGQHIHVHDFIDCRFPVACAYSYMCSVNVWTEDVLLSESKFDPLQFAKCVKQSHRVGGAREERYRGRRLLANKIHLVLRDRLAVINEALVGNASLRYKKYHWMQWATNELRLWHWPLVLEMAPLR